MPRLNKIEVYAIRWLSSQGKDVKDISLELKIGEKQVQNILEKNHKTTDKELNIKNGSETVTNQPSVSSLMIKKTANKQNNSVSVMTKEASELSDANRQKNNTSISKSFKNAIYRPNSK